MIWAGSGTFMGTFRSTAEPAEVLGTRTVFCDIAGHVSEVLTNPIVTVAAVGVSSRVLTATRRRLLADFRNNPKKWRDGKLRGLRRVLDFIVANHLPVVIYQLHRADPDLWRRHFEQGKAFSKVARSKGEHLAVLNPDLNFRLSLLSS